MPVVWVIVFGAIALVGLVVVVSYGVWLSHKVADVWSEVKVLADRGGQVVALLDEIQPAEVRGRDPQVIEGEIVTATDRSGGPTT